MGHMAAMAQLCKFVAMHGLVQKETEEEKAERLEKEKTAAKREEEIRKEKAAYLEFWTKKYIEISDSSAVQNFEYALENVDNRWVHFLYGDTWAKDIHSKLRYPDLHCKALMATHHDVIYKHTVHLSREAYHGKGCYSSPDVTPEEKRRIHKIGRVCNWWLNGAGWRGC